MKLSLMSQACLRDSAREAVRGGAQKFGIFEQVTPEYVDATHASGFRDFLLKPELLRGIVDRGFEHPSEVQHECIPQAVLGTDLLCQAKSGMGVTAVFVLACLHQLDASKKICQDTALAAAAT